MDCYLLVVQGSGEYNRSYAFVYKTSGIFLINESEPYDLYSEPTTFTPTYVSTTKQLEVCF